MKLLIISAVLFLINNSCFGVAGVKNESDKMIYIKVKLVEGKPSEINYEILNGKIKTPKVQTVKPRDIYYELISNGETVIIEGSVSDPSIQNYEYAGDNGEIKSVEVKQDSAEIIIRTNYDAKISKINLYKIPSDRSLNKGINNYTPLVHLT